MPSSLVGRLRGLGVTRRSSRRWIGNRPAELAGGQEVEVAADDQERVLGSRGDGGGVVGEEVGDQLDVGSREAVVVDVPVDPREAVDGSLNSEYSSRNRFRWREVHAGTTGRSRDEGDDRAFVLLEVVRAGGGEGLKDLVLRAQRVQQTPDLLRRTVNLLQGSDVDSIRSRREKLL